MNGEQIANTAKNTRSMRGRCSSATTIAIAEANKGMFIARSANSDGPNTFSHAHSMSM